MSRKTNPRQDSSQFEPVYPSAGDGKGTARIRHDGAQYFFGPYESPLSHVMFGMWKQHLLKTGESRSGTQLRPLAKAVLSAGVPPEPPLVTHRWFALSVLAAALCIALATYTGFCVYSDFKPVKVDGIELTQSDIDSVRASRLFQITDQKHSMPEKLRARAADIASQLRTPNKPALPDGYPPKSTDDFATNPDKDGQNAIRITSKPPIP